MCNNNSLNTKIFLQFRIKVTYPSATRLRQFHVSTHILYKHPPCYHNGLHFIYLLSCTSPLPSPLSGILQFASLHLIFFPQSYQESKNRIFLRFFVWILGFKRSSFRSKPRSEILSSLFSPFCRQSDPSCRIFRFWLKEAIALDSESSVKKGAESKTRKIGSEALTVTVEWRLLQLWVCNLIHGAVSRRAVGIQAVSCGFLEKMLWRGIFRRLIYRTHGFGELRLDLSMRPLRFPVLLRNLQVLSLISILLQMCFSLICALI